MESQPFLVAGIPVTAEPGIDLALATNCAQFQEWLASVDRQRFNITSINIQSLDCWRGKVGFVKFECQVFDAKTNKKLPGIVFARGGAVAILVVFVCEGEEYVVLTVQPRIASGSFALREVCAGTLEGSGDFGGTAVRELKEELELEVKKEELIDLSAMAGFARGAYPSPGACDETIRIFLLRREVTRAELDSMSGRLTGAADEGEQITLQIAKLDELIAIPDLKTIAAYALYQRFRDQIDAGTKSSS